MQNFFRISDAASLGLHTMSLLAGREDALLSTQEVARALQASDNHLAKVMQRLARAGLVVSTRGPRGGYALARPAGTITLLEIYEAIDGVAGLHQCLLGLPKCNWRKCVLGDLVRSINHQARDFLNKTTLDQLQDHFNWEKLQHADS